MSGIAEGVTCHCLTKFGNSTDVTCIDKVGIFLFFAANTEKLSESLGVSSTSVYRSHIGSEFTGNNLEVGQLSNKWVGNGFKYL